MALLSYEGIYFYLSQFDARILGYVMISYNNCVWSFLNMNFSFGVTNTPKGNFTLLIYKATNY